MFDTTTIEIAIGLVFIYFLLSLLCSTVNETIAGLVDKRARYLERAIRHMLRGEGGDHLVAEKLYDHPLIKAIARQKGFQTWAGDSLEKLRHRVNRARWLPWFHPSYLPGEKKQKPSVRPSYIPAKTFAIALVDVLHENWHEPGFEEAATPVADMINKIAGVEVTHGSYTDLTKVEKDLKEGLKNIEVWFDDAMGRVSGWYRQRTQWALLAIALVVAFAANADTIAIVRTLQANPIVRQALVARTVSLVETDTAAKTTTKTGSEAGAVITQARPSAETSRQALSPEGLVSEIRSLPSIGLPLGWPKGLPFAGVGGFFMWLLGIFLTVAAILLGAPFWFDVLKKVAGLRTTGPPPEVTKSLDAGIGGGQGI